MMFFVILVLCIVDLTSCVTDELVDYINSNDFGWKATKSNQFFGMSLDELKKYVSQVIPNEYFEKNFRLHESQKVIPNDLPDSYNFYEAHSECAQAVRDQGKCGSCWAFSTSETMEDRYCAENGNTTRLSPQDFVSCDQGDHGCNGGDYPSAWSYAINHGVVTDACLPYTSSGGTVAPCPNKCKNSEDWEASKFKVEDYDHFGGEQYAMQPIYDGGSIQAGMRVYSDFMSYTSGVYVHKYGDAVGYHAVKFVGWGVYKTPYETTPYWIVQNSWGSRWGQKGFFWIAKGKGECWISMWLYAPTKVYH